MSEPFNVLFLTPYPPPLPIDLTSSERRFFTSLHTAPSTYRGNRCVRPHSRVPVFYWQRNFGVDGVLGTICAFLFSF